MLGRYSWEYATLLGPLVIVVMALSRPLPVCRAPSCENQQHPQRCVIVRVAWGYLIWGFIRLIHSVSLATSCPGKCVCDMLADAELVLRTNPRGEKYSEVFVTY